MVRQPKSALRAPHQAAKAVAVAPGVEQVSLDRPVHFARREPFSCVGRDRAGPRGGDDFAFERFHHRAARAVGAWPTERVARRLSPCAGHLGPLFLFGIGLTGLAGNR